jgi:hypothetical protein
MRMKQLKTTAYHPQANGLVEKFHRQLKESLRAREAGLGGSAPPAVDATGTKDGAFRGYWPLIGKAWEFLSVPEAELPGFNLCSGVTLVNPLQSRMIRKSVEWFQPASKMPAPSTYSEEVLNLHQSQGTSA